MSEKLEAQKPLAAGHATLGGYALGYILSIALTLAAYFFVRGNGATRDMLIGVVVGLALVQFLVQLFFFLHLGRETKPRWKLFVLLMMMLVVGILVFGSLWIMQNLNVRMTPQQINTYMQNQDSL